MFSSRLVFVCTMCVVGMAATAGAASSQADSAAPRAAARDVASRPRDAIDELLARTLARTTRVEQVELLAERSKLRGDTGSLLARRDLRGERGLASTPARVVACECHIRHSRRKRGDDR